MKQTKLLIVALVLVCIGAGIIASGFAFPPLLSPSELYFLLVWLTGVVLVGIGTQLFLVWVRIQRKAKQA